MNSYRLTKLDWKKLSQLSQKEILFDKSNQLLLRNILSYKIQPFEIENLPTSYIMSFICVLQEFIFNFCYHQNSNNFVDNNMDDYNDQIIEQNKKILELQNKVLELEEIITDKDKNLNETHKNLCSVLRNYNQLKEDYKLKIMKLQKQIKNNNESFKEMDNKLTSTNNYLVNLIKSYNSDNNINDLLNSNYFYFNEKNNSPNKINRIKNTRYESVDNKPKKHDSISYLSFKFRQNQEKINDSYNDGINYPNRFVRKKFKSNTLRK